MRCRSAFLLIPALVLSAGGDRLQQGESFALLQDGHVNAFGSGDDCAAQARAAGGPCLWFRHQGAAYVVRDPKLLAEARAAIAPCDRLGAEQGKLGAQQGRLGTRQAALGTKQGALGTQMAGAGPEAAARLSAKMEDLSRQQEALGAEQEKLGQRQEALGRQQEAASEAALEKLRGIRGRALASGLAVRQ